MDATGAKVLAMVLLGVVSLCLGFLPIKLGRFFMDSNENPWKKTLTSLLLCFGGGVLFATGFIHMLPEVIFTICNLNVLDNHVNTVIDIVILRSGRVWSHPDSTLRDGRLPRFLSVADSFSFISLRSVSIISLSIQPRAAKHQFTGN